MVCILKLIIKKKYMDIEKLMCCEEVYRECDILYSIYNLKL